MGVRLSQLVARELTIDPMIEGVTADSRKVKPGFLFAALPGTKADGLAFVPSAVAAGAAAVIATAEAPGVDVPFVVTPDPRRAYALAAAAFWKDQPATVVAVTGTNGKTSVAGFCRQIFNAGGHRAASMGTLGVYATGPGGFETQLTPPGLTTPDAADVAELMSRLVEEGVTHLALEASSHGVDQRRLDGARITAAGFLNLTQDHLDYHLTMDAYRDAKLRLFTDLLPRGGTAVLNADSDAYDAFAAAAVTNGQSVMSVGEAGQGLTLVARTPTLEGQRLTIRAEGQTYEVNLPLLGGYQASNALVAAGLCIAAGEPAAVVMKALEALEGAPGRLQLIGAGPRGGVAYVDYAHTPDGLETILNALRPHVEGKLIVVFGAGGDRDRTKRPLMGGIAARLADVAIVTDDNPRSEDPAAIRAEVMTGTTGMREIGDRRAAIRAGVALLEAGDVLVVAGKGHEPGQTVAGIVHPFNDVIETEQALRGKP
ncbi:MAG: UDP-N-acetylmuramoyl-L-alanyl-D-glutamate--2,6-diaminopimelate ligase [Phenylobacterium sp.]|uniref:UDP-N-acetylmuramoyl-L-alanyl-D-glutamate--2, 6-diaminopimelate ligase n=1 Tax=Phenylobacterium sp. TaxID=1871053 RepID=UPI001B65C744|nr:UDP-N-acetylmuramoyl-L-alanyl-D-glutamate--2,6-diaminopimelate ligase [Phenylobacterium sp.]MBP7648586.1 UDP-N-acetylmuramoyl-L-alanyl-D-glutamate--2,6-diaminopimelate ligase [Phenylobacterium sp.]MBP7814796.1 UDP-N-acetylmuramoyl-L-alanyl-D-glutamate--2,6-diaminopimelate ligase [Phenylobacterium sp.]MBP9232282.1 UDP-N-acetylmuramoyl-L-alanyl-D-glutamate--2,6-diaminopimelate ligase [Phenylobacterium sp.]MBP9755735.1 UDP-N-acetylmuramoyl-L-alanyl-D-glutamate--2,6-diaminopimelate ligase [Pheny